MRREPTTHTTSILGFSNNGPDNISILDLHLLHIIPMAPIILIDHFRNTLIAVINSLSR